MKLAIFFCVLCMFAVYSAQSASLYRWVDNDGKVHYTEQPPPASAAKKVEEKSIGTAPSEGSQLPYATRLAVKNFPVTLFSSDCGDPCTKARELLSKRGIPFTSKDAGLVEVQTELTKLTGTLSVPVLLVGSTIQLKGFTPDDWNTALNDAGYPKSAPYTANKPKEPAKPEVKSEQKAAKSGGEAKR